MFKFYDRVALESSKKDDAEIEKMFREFVKSNDKKNIEFYLAKDNTPIMKDREINPDFSFNDVAYEGILLFDGSDAKYFYIRCPSKKSSTGDYLLPIKYNDSRVLRICITTDSHLIL